MVKYICERCGYKVDHRHNFIKHLYRKFPCKAIVNDISIETLKEKFNVLVSTNVSTNVSTYTENVSTDVTNVSTDTENVSTDTDVTKISCQYCNKIFKHRQSKYNHEQKHCKLRPIEVFSIVKSEQFNESKVQKNELIEKMSKQIEELQQQNYQLIDKVGNKIHIENQHIENQQINIQINGFGNEVADYITINISSPNTENLRSLHEQTKLNHLLELATIQL